MVDGGYGGIDCDIQGVVTTYFASLFHLTGSGLLGNTIAGVLRSPDKATWVTLALIIMPATLCPAVSMAADYWGRRWSVTAGMVAGFVGTIIASRSTSIGMLIAGQSIAGFGQTSTALAHAIVSEIVPRKYRAHAQTTIQAGVGLSAVSALYIGGAMCKTDTEGFRNFFYLTAAIFFCSALIFALVYRPPARELQHLSTVQKVRKFDIGGTILSIIGFLGICIGLGWSQNPYSWTNAHILAPFLIGVCSVIILGIYARWIKTDGIWHREFFHSRNFTLAILGIFIEGFVFLCFNNYVPYEISFLYGKNLFQTALEYSIAWYMVPVAATVAGIYVTKTRNLLVPLIVSYGMMAIFWATMAGTAGSTSNDIYGLVVLFGLGLGIAIPALVTVVQLSVPPELIATVTGLMLATRAIGGTVGLAVYTAIFNGAISDNFASKVATATIPLGLPQSSLGPLLGSLAANDQQALQHIPGITPRIIGAAVAAMKDAFHIGFRNVYVTALAMAAAAVLREYTPSTPVWI
jgi:MFS family permease